jgi:hypothetical protein
MRMLLTLKDGTMLEANKRIFKQTKRGIVIKQDYNTYYCNQKIVSFQKLPFNLKEFLNRKRANLYWKIFDLKSNFKQLINKIFNNNNNTFKNGFKFVFAEDWLIYAIDKNKNLYFVNTELWEEWLDVPQEETFKNNSIKKYMLPIALKENYLNWHTTESKFSYIKHYITKIKIYCYYRPKFFIKCYFKKLFTGK